MTHSEYVLVALTILMFILGWLGVVCIKRLRKTRHNTELWGTIFEGVTNKLINLDAIKKPEVFIEKKAKRSGQDKDTPEEQASKISSKANQ